MIIPVYRVVTSQFPIAATTAMEPGLVVKLNASTGKAEKCGATEQPIGLSADKNRAAEAFEWVNRLTDAGNETAASGLLSVYHGGGEFYLDVNDGAITTPGGTVITGAVTNGLTLAYGTKLYVAASGLLHTTDANSGAGLVAAVLETTEDLASGIPGEYAPGSSVQYVDDTVPRSWIKVKLLI
jgi:hypothetical protein